MWAKLTARKVWLPVHQTWTLAARSVDCSRNLYACNIWFLKVNRTSKICTLGKINKYGFSRQTSKLWLRGLQRCHRAVISAGCHWETWIDFESHERGAIIRILIIQELRSKERWIQLKQQPRQKWSRLNQQQTWNTGISCSKIRPEAVTLVDCCWLPCKYCGFNAVSDDSDISRSNINDQNRNQKRAKRPSLKTNKDNKPLRSMKMSSGSAVNLLSLKVLYMKCV